MLFPILSPNLKIIIQPYGAAVIDSRFGNIEVINKIGAEILTSCTGDSSLLDLVKKIALEYKEEEKLIRNDLLDFLGYANELGHIIFSDKRMPPIKVNVVDSHNSVLAIQSDLEITLKCNLRCKHCFAEAGTGLPDELSYKDWIKTINKLKGIGVQVATITGGEPLIRKDIIKILSYCSEEFITQLFSNGTLIDKHFAREISGLKLNFVQISLDSVVPEINDRIRGEGSWHRALKGAELLISHGVRVNIGTVIFSDTLEELEKIARLCMNIGATLRASTLEGRGKAVELGKEYFCSEEKKHLLKTKLDDLKNKYPHVILDPTQHSLSIDNRSKCKFCYGLITVGADGKIRPCLESRSFFYTVNSKLNSKTRFIDDIDFSFNSNRILKILSKDVGEFLTPNIQLCGDCKNLRNICDGCMVAGYFMSKKERACKLNSYNKEVIT